MDSKAKRLLSKFGADVDNYVLVKNILKTCKKDTEPQELIGRLKEISNYITCGADSTLAFRETVVVEHLDDTDS